jgi:hypothetical protein
MYANACAFLSTECLYRHLYADAELDAFVRVRAIASEFLKQAALAKRHSAPVV